MKILKFSLMALILGTGLAHGGIIPESRSVLDKENYKPHIGLAIGIASPEGSSDPVGNFSVTVGYQPYIPYSLGLEVGYADFDEQSNDLRRTNLLLKGKFNFGGDILLINKSYVGLAVGPAWEKEIGRDGLAFIFKPEVGFDYPIGYLQAGQLYLGASLSYQVSSGGTPDTLNANGVVTYWY